MWKICVGAGTTLLFISLIIQSPVIKGPAFGFGLVLLVISYVVRQLQP